VISLAAAILTGCGAALVMIGVFFLVARPPLLPEDARFIGSTIEHIADTLPALDTWLRRVFWVLGGYIATTGVLVVYIANTGVRTGSTGALVQAAGGRGHVGRLDGRGQLHDPFSLQVGAARARRPMGTRTARGPGRTVTPLQHTARRSANWAGQPGRVAVFPTRGRSPLKRAVVPDGR
jgi:hypothetical protein